MCRCASIPNMRWLEARMISASQKPPENFSSELVSLLSLNMARIDTEPNQHMFGSSVSRQAVKLHD